MTVVDNGEVRLPGEPGLHVVVVGAGFGGLKVVRSLARAPVRITVIDRRNHHLFQPLLYQVASAALDPSDIAYPIRTVFRWQDNVERVLMGVVEDVDLDGRAVVLEDGARIAYDRLVIATGATHSYFGNEAAWRPVAPGLKTVEDALEIRRRVLAAFEHAERYPDEQRAWLTFVVIGAGPTGVELAGALVEIAFHALARDFDAIDPRSARVILLEGGPRVLPAYPESLSANARRQLEGLGVEVRTGHLAQALDDGGVTLDDGTRIDTHTILWAAGVHASPLGARLGAPLDAVGRVEVAPDLSVPGHPAAFVIGDLAHIPQDGGTVPGVAPAAIQAGKHVAAQIRRDLRGEARTRFRYRDKGSLATIGRARAVADLGRLAFGGFFAWLAWMAIHIVYLIGFRNRLFVVLSWGWSWLTFRRGSRLITGGRRAGWPDRPDES